mgnify:FL=1
MGCAPTKNQIYDESNPIKPLALDIILNANAKTAPSLNDLSFSEKLPQSAPHSYYNLSSTFRSRIVPIKLNQVLFHFDTTSMQFISFDLNTEKWTTNNLSEARLVEVNQSSNLSALTDIRRHILDKLSSYSMVAVDTNKIEIIGPAHFQYNISLNCFIVRPPMKAIGIKKPCLAFTGRRLFAFSGEQKNDYVSNSEVYDFNSKTWSTLKEVPAPHGKGAACCFFGDSNVVKVVIAGGYAQKDPLTVSREIHLYDDYKREWSSFEIYRSGVAQFPGVIDLSVYIGKRGIIHLQQMTEEAGHYEINFYNGQLLKAPSIKETISKFKEFDMLQLGKDNRGESGMLLFAKELYGGSKAAKLCPDYYALVSDDNNENARKEWFALKRPRQPPRSQVLKP